MCKELLECPFCGGEANIVFSGSRTDEHWKGFIVAKCETCGATSKGSFYFGEPKEISLAETVGGEKEIKRWNRRW